jgi:DNA-directed RNA polymerase specialized sigma subunit
VPSVAPFKRSPRMAIGQNHRFEIVTKYQAVITLHFFENTRLTDIAACLGENPSTVRTQLSRATAKLRAKLSAGDNCGRSRP